MSFHDYVLIGISFLLATGLILVFLTRKVVKTERVNEQRKREELINKMMGGESIFIINRQTDTYKLLFAQSGLNRDYPPEGCYSEATENYIQNSVHRYDKELMRKATTIDSIVEGLAKQDEYTVIYRDINSGVSRWYRMRAVKLSGNEILIGFTDYHKEYIENAIREKVEEDSFAMFVVNLDSGMLKIAKKSPWDSKWSQDMVVPYSDVIMDLAGNYDGEIKDFYTKLSSLEYAKDFFATEEKFTFTYKSKYVTDNKWIILTGRLVIRHDDGTPAVYVLMYSLLDSFGIEKAELEGRLSEAQKLVSNMVRGYDIVYIVNMIDDSVEIRKVAKNMLEYGRQFSTFSEARDFFCTEVLHPRDRKRIEQELSFDIIRQKLKKSPSYNVEYCTIIQNGGTYGGVMSVTAIDEDKIIIGMADKDEELTKRHLEEKRYGEYFALFVVDIDTQMIRTIKNLVAKQDKEKSKPVPYGPAIRKFAATLKNTEAREFFTQLSDMNYVKRELAMEDKHSYTYKSDRFKGKWVKATSYVFLRKKDGTPAMFSLGFSLVDSLEADRAETQARMKQQMETISGLASDYTVLYHVNLDSGEYRPYYIAQKITDMKVHIEQNTQYIDLFNIFINSDRVFADDRQSLHEFYPSNEELKAKLEHKKNISMLFRRNYSGRMLWSEVSVVKCEDVKEPAHMVIFGFKEVDAKVREEQEHQKQLAEALESAEVANKSKTSFLFNMSHDIRTPMNAITGFTTMAKKYLDDKDRVEDYLNKIEVSGKQLLSLVNQVLEMSRIESGRIEFDNKPVNIKEKHDSLVMVLSAQARVNGLEFESSLDDIIHYNVMADDAKLGQIALNIAGNALKYTPAGGKIFFRLREIPCDKEGWARYVFTVADTGIGMSREYLKELFEPFTREKSSTVSKIQGTGLGMAIVKTLIDILGGKIEVQSELGKGTKFDITIDFELTDEEMEKGHNEAANISAPAAFEGKRVLLVEDNELNREIAKDILQEIGLIVDEADDGDIAVSMVKAAAERGKEAEYNLVLMDIQMPRMSGYEATRAIRAMKDSPASRWPIIAMTANAFDEDRKNAFAAGMDAHLAKPIEIDKLMETLARFL